MHNNSISSVGSGYLLDRINDRLGAAVSGVEPRKLKGALEEALAGGKRIRPLMTLASSAAVGGNEREAIDLGVALELLHTSSLIHDDIMDGSPLRRGRAATYASHGVPMAILAGDTLVALAFRTMSEVVSPRSSMMMSVFTDAFLQVCQGQALDLELPAVPDPNSGVHSSMVEKKTAKLFEAAAVLGGLTGTSDPRTIHALQTYGLSVGMAYQAKDDLLDAIGDETLMGKPAGADVRNSRQTYLRLARPGQAAEHYSLITTIERVATLVEKLTMEAIRALDHLPMTPARELLKDSALSLVGRNA